jgi:hypothetical protein
MTEQDLARFFERERQQSKRAKYIMLKSCKDAPRILANDIEAEAAARLRELGFQVSKQSHKAHFDILADGMRVEVKASRWDGRRYQFNLRDNDADVVLFGCVDGSLTWFVVPFTEVRGKTVVKITEHDPADYIGKLTMFYEAWDVLPDLAKSARNPYQPDLLTYRT